jgi:hypothetical protein
MFFTGTALLGYNQLTPHLHYEMCQTAENVSAYHRLAAIVPRDHYKTTIYTIIYCVWRGLLNPNETGLLIFNSMKNAQRALNAIRGAFESAPFLRKLFPHLLPELSDRWNKDEACLPRTSNWGEATWTIAGWDTKITSGHWDYIIYDDPVDEENFESVELMRRLTGRFEQRVGLLRPPHEQRDIIVVGNHWSMIDLHSYILEKHPEYFVYFRQAIEGGKPIFPEMYSLRYLLGLQQADPVNFAAQWMNNPMDEALAENKRSHVQYYKRRETGVELPTGEFVPFGMMNIYAAADPRHTLSTKYAEKLTSRNAICVAGIDHRHRRYLLDEWAMRGDPVSFLNAMVEMWDRWRPHGLLKIGLEAYGYQGALAPLAAEIWKNKLDSPVLELLERDTTKSKETRIRGGTGFFRKGLGYIHKTHAMFFEEYISFPASKFRDLLDCWAWCTHMMSTPTADEDYAAQEVVDTRYMQSLRSAAAI